MCGLVMQEALLWAEMQQSVYSSTEFSLAFYC